MNHTKRILALATIEARLAEIDTTEQGNKDRALVYAARNFILQQKDNPNTDFEIKRHIMRNPLQSVDGLPTAESLRGSSVNYWYCD